MAADFFKLDTLTSREVVDDLRKLVTRCGMVAELASALGLA
jgi:hypothetical protein